MIIRKIREFADDLEESTPDALADELYSMDRAGGIHKANSRARLRIKTIRDKTGSIEDIVSGKKIISRLSEWSQAKFNVSFGAATILKELNMYDIPDEVSSVVEAIEKQRDFAIN